MAFIAKNPLSAAKLETSPPSPIEGARGLFAKEDGWYDIDDNGNVKKIATGASVFIAIPNETPVKDIFDAVVAGKAVFVKLTGQGYAPLAETEGLDRYGEAYAYCYLRFYGVTQLYQGTDAMIQGIKFYIEFDEDGNDYSEFEYDNGGLISEKGGYINNGELIVRNSPFTYEDGNANGNYTVATRGYVKNKIEELEAEVSNLRSQITNTQANNSIFIAEYNVTPAKEVIEAMVAGKIVFCKTPNYLGYGYAYATVITSYVEDYGNDGMYWVRFGCIDQGDDNSFTTLLVECYYETYEGEEYSTWSTVTGSGSTLVTSQS